MKNKNFTFVFDLDNTLVKTNQANNNAYKMAISEATGSIDFALIEKSMGRGRFTRSKLSKLKFIADEMHFMDELWAKLGLEWAKNDLLYPQDYYICNNERIKNYIIKQKEQLFPEHLCETHLNVQLAKILRLLHMMGCKTILLTECRNVRAMQICDFWFLSHYFSNMYFKENIKNGNKYQFLETIQIPLKSVVLFENEHTEIRKAIRNGIDVNQIITINFHNKGPVDRFTEKLANYLNSNNNKSLY